MNFPRLLPHQENLAALAAGALSLAVYATTMNPTVSFIDSGELAAAAATLGIPHPTGYPLFAILGRIAASIPAGHETIGRMNFMSALLVSASVGVFLKLLVLLQNALVIFPGKSFKMSQHAGFGHAFAGALCFAFCTTVWAQSVAVEVYALHVFLLVLVLFTFLKGLSLTAESGAVSPFLPLFSFLLGLSFANHMTTILLAPAFLYLFFAVLHRNKESMVLILKLVPFFLLGLSVYLFLPFRSSQNPVLDWGHPADLERLLWHVSGKQYRSWIFSSFESAEKQLKYFFGNFPFEFHWGVIVCIGAGLWNLFRRRRRLFVFVSLLVAGCLAYSINYDIHDIDAYFLLAYAGAAIGAAAGITDMARVVGEFREGVWRRFSWMVFLLLPFLQWWSNGTRVDESDNFLVHDYTKSVFNGLDSNAVVITYQWDYFVSASYYYQHINKERPDVVVIDKELLRRSWYFIQLQRNHPRIFDRSRAAIGAFLQELSRFEHGLPYNGQIIEARFNAMINDMINKCFEEGPVYVGPEMEPQFGPSYERIPEGLMMRLVKPGSVTSLKHFEPIYRSTGFRSRLTKGLQTQYAQAFTYRAVWKMQRGDFSELSHLLDKALSFDAGYLPALRLKAEQSNLSGRNR